MNALAGAHDTAVQMIYRPRTSARCMHHAE
jgi:hypothetical protein